MHQVTISSGRRPLEDGPGPKFPGGHRSRVTPVPIPNTEVKPATADGTARAGGWESRSLPGIYFASRPSGPTAATPALRRLSPSPHDLGFFLVHATAATAGGGAAERPADGLPES